MKIQNNWLYPFIVLGIVFTLTNSCKKAADEDNNNSTKVTDAEGNVYNTVTIGTQVWMAENLKTTKYNDGTPIPNVTDNEEWSNLTTGAYCINDNFESNTSTYGRLYNWFAINKGKLAPKGWHVPTYDEWTVLENYLISNGYNFDGTKTRNKIAKSLASTSNWLSSTEEGAIGNDLTKNNTSGFIALPGGSRDYKGEFDSVGEDGVWWSSTGYGTSRAYFRYLGYLSYGLGSNFYNKGCGFSVRCLKDN
jgi:uncharacterized protein (TIGR02145 family)